MEFKMKKMGELYVAILSVDGIEKMRAIGWDIESAIKISIDKYKEVMV
jgi:hypothetical protein